MSKKILFINQEIAPYVPESELSVMGRKLPQKMQEAGFEIRTFMPKWGNINERRGQLHEVIRLSGMNLIIDETDHPLVIKVASIPTSRLQVYFIDNDDYFLKRLMTEDENGKEYEDNGERAIFFARGVLETVKKLRWTPDIIQCQGPMTSVIPLYVKTAYKDEPSFANTKVVTSLFDKNLKEGFGPHFKEWVPFKEAEKSLFEKYDDSFGSKDIAQLAIDYSDGVIASGSEADKELIDYAAQAGKSLLTGIEDDKMSEQYAEFYNNLLGE